MLGQSIKRYFSNFIKFLKAGGVSYVNVSLVLPSGQLSGKTIFVSGGTSGIGLGIAKLFLAEGATVIISGRNQQKLSETEQTFGNPHLHTVCWDISDEKVAVSMIQKIVAEVGPVDIFVNNAGVYESASWDKVTPEMYDKVIDTNQRGLYFMCQSEGRYFVENGRKGKIINITSIAGILTGFNPYNVSKWGATCITKGLAKELITKGVIVNGIAPGNVVTNIHAGVRGKKVEDNAYTSQHLTKRYTLVEEVATLALYLASDAANNVVGQVIAIDGGWTLQ
jgi:NAD(P)-dependent dehydrogenase (short-subunit alcohol dehydrogenase family)